VVCERIAYLLLRIEFAVTKGVPGRHPAIPRNPEIPRFEFAVPVYRPTAAFAAKSHGDRVAQEP